MPRAWPSFASTRARAARTYFIQYRTVLYCTFSTTRVLYCKSYHFTARAGPQDPLLESAPRTSAARRIAVIAHYRGQRSSVGGGGINGTRGGVAAKPPPIVRPWTLCTLALALCAQSHAVRLLK